MQWVRVDQNRSRVWGLTNNYKGAKNHLTPHDCHRTLLIASTAWLLPSNSHWVWRHIHGEQSMAHCWTWSSIPTLDRLSCLKGSRDDASVDLINSLIIPGIDIVILISIPFELHLTPKITEMYANIPYRVVLKHIKAINYDPSCGSSTASFLRRDLFDSPSRTGIELVWAIHVDRIEVLLQRAALAVRVWRDFSSLPDWIRGQWNRPKQVFSCQHVPPIFIFIKV